MKRIKKHILYSKKNLEKTKKYVYKAFKEAERDENSGDPEELRKAHEYLREVESIIGAFYTGEVE